MGLGFRVCSLLDKGSRTTSNQSYTLAILELYKYASTDSKSLCIRVLDMEVGTVGTVRQAKTLSEMTVQTSSEFTIAGMLLQG